MAEVQSIGAGATNQAIKAVAIARSYLSEEGVVYVKGKRVRVETPGADRPVPVQVDGDAAGHTPVDIDLLPVRLPFIVP